MNISPKTLPPVVLAILAAAVVWIITGDSSSLLLIALGLVSSGGVYLAAPASGVKQEEVEALADIKLGVAQVITPDDRSLVKNVISNVVDARKAATAKVKQAGFVTIEQAFVILIIAVAVVVLLSAVH